MKSTVSKLGQRIKKVREQLNLSQTELAEMSGIAQPNISSLEKGKRKGTKHIIPLAHALQVEPDWLANGVKPSNSKKIALTTTEQDLVDGYRKLSKKKKKTALDWITDAAGKSKPKKAKAINGDSSLAERIRKTRLSRNLQQPELAAKVGVSQAAISKLESGLTVATKNIVTLAQVLEVDPIWLESGIGAENARTTKLAEDEAELILNLRKLGAKKQKDAHALIV